MEVLLTCHRDPWHRRGGSEAVVRRLAEGLARDHDVAVATALEEDLEPEETVEGVRVRRFPQQGVAHLTLRAPGYRSFLREGWDGVLLYGQGVWVSTLARGLVDDLDARVLYFPVGFYNLQRAHARSLPKRLFDRTYQAAVQRPLLEGADVVAALTRGQVDEIRSMAEPRRLVRIPNGVDPEPYREPPDLDPREHLGLDEDAPLFVYLGGDYPNKQLDLACAAVERLADTGDADPVLCLCGTGTEAWDHPPTMRGLGYVPEDLKLALLAAADALVLASDFEGFGLVLLEALASGTPFVSTPVGAAPELADQGGGLVAEGGPKALSEALEEALETPWDPTELRAVAGRYDWEVIVPRIEAEIAGEAGPADPAAWEPQEP